MLGTVQGAELLIKELYLDLKFKVNQWSLLTHQTPQARMGYVGQHLVSVVTGYQGGKSGARGYDLIISKDFFGNVTQFGEIKTCYRVDQLGSCSRCSSAVSSLETACSSCGSIDIIRNDDSKWLISIRNDYELENILEPIFYYFVLFEFENLRDATNNNIVITIHRVDPKVPGFALCMLDYYFNIRYNSKSAAPLNLWPHQFKFLLTEPTLIYRSIIDSNNSIYTTHFPIKNEEFDGLNSLSPFSRATNLTLDALQEIAKLLSINVSRCDFSNKRKLISIIDDFIIRNNISWSVISKLLAEKIYLPLLEEHVDKIPNKIKVLFPNYFKK